MTTRRFPTPAELRAQREAEAATKIEATLDAIEKMLRDGLSTMLFSGDDIVRDAVRKRLSASGWLVTFGSGGEGAWIKVEAASGSRDSYPPHGGDL